MFDPEDYTLPRRSKYEMDFTWNDLWVPDKHLKRSKSGKESQKSALKMATEASIA